MKVRLNGVGAVLSLFCMFGLFGVHITMLVNDRTSRVLVGYKLLTLGFIALFAIVAAVQLYFPIWRAATADLPDIPIDSNALRITYVAFACGTFASATLLFMFTTPSAEVLSPGAYGLVGLNVLAWLMLSIGRKS